MRTPDLRVHTRDSLARMRRVASVMSILSILSAGAAHAQSSAQAYVYRYLDDVNPFASTTSGACFSQDAGAGAVSASASCSLAPVPGGHGSLTASSGSSFDPLTGTFKSKASIVANGYTLTPFTPTFDSNNDRVYTGDVTPDAVGAYTFVSLSDVFSIASATPGVTPASISFFLDINGTLQADNQGIAGAFVGNFVNFCTAPSGVCGTSAASLAAYSGIAGMNLDDKGNGGFSVNSNAPVGETPADFSFSGSQTNTSINGRLTIGNLPIAGNTPYDFNFIFGTQSIVYHPTSVFALSTQGCYPVTNGPGCPDLSTLQDPTDLVGEATADFSHTLTFAGYQVLDANGNDITSSVTLNFRSGLGAAVVATPEPGTLSLVGGALGLIAVRLRRRVRRTPVSNL